MKRRHIPLKVKLEAALYQLGLDPAHVRLDHTPPLAMREVFYWRDEKHTTYEPDELDPRHMQFLSTADHAEKTTGRRGTSKLSKRGGDLSEIAKAKRISKAEEDFRRRVLEKYKAKPKPKPKSRWPKRKVSAR